MTIALNYRGLTTRKGAKWTYTTVTRLLNDPIISGKRRMNYTKSLGENKHWEIKDEKEWIFQDVPAVISPGQYRKIRSILDAQKANRKDRKPPRHAKYLFTGLMHCSCGGKMSVPNARMKNYSCQVCKAKMGIQDMEEIFFANLTQTLSTSESMDEAHKREDAEIQKLHDECLALATEQQAVQKKIDALFRLHEEEQIPTNSFNDHFQPLQDQLTKIKLRNQELVEDIEERKRRKMDKETALEESKKLDEHWPDMDFSQKRLFVENACRNITIHPDTTKI
ncbi:MAG: recombinase family protein, partial [Bacteroidota bacterium]